MSEQVNNNTELDSSQGNQDKSSLSSWGGKRPNSGRPPGESKTSILRRKIADHLDEDDFADLVQEAKERAKKSDKLLIWLLEQVTGKARQQIGLDGGEEDKPVAILSTVIREEVRAERQRLDAEDIIEQVKRQNNLE